MCSNWMKTAGALVVLSGLAACSSPYDGGYRNPPPAYGGYPTSGVGGYPAAYPQGRVVPAAVETGHVAHIEWLPQARAPEQHSGAGALIGAVVGGVLGNQVGGGMGRAAATAAGVIGGAVAGNAIESRQSGGGAGLYRIVLSMDRGGQRAYEVPNPGDLRVGDRVQVQGNGQISRY